MPDPRPSRFARAEMVIVGPLVAVAAIGGIVSAARWLLSFILPESTNS